MKCDTTARVCVIGAGPSGITAAKNLLQAGIENIVVYEKNDQVGGNWVYSPRLSHSSVFNTTHIISSKTMSEYIDYPMPADYPDYPSHRQVLAYFQGYARHFGVEPYIRFNCEVTHAEKQPDESWRITLADGTVEEFDFLLVCNGHHWDPRLPEYPGQFTGEFLHSHDFKSAMPFQDKRVLVIGGGNSACDIAVETSRVAALTAVSMRRGYYIVPKFIMGYPTDVFNARVAMLPRWLRIPLSQLSLRLAVGTPQQYGLQKPDHRILESHPTANSELLYFIRHGKIHPRRDIQRFDGQNVHFVDGKVEEYDAVIAATGFKITFPFFDRSFVDFSDGDVPLFLRMFHPDHPSLVFIGLFQPQGAIWPLADLQAKLAANTIAGRCQLPADMRERIARELETTRRHYIATPRHSTEIEYHPFYRALERAIPVDAPEWRERERNPVHI
jgi:hypothetical protein